MRSVAGLLLLTLLTSCDFVYSVRRATPVDATLDAMELDRWARQQPGYRADDAHAWDGEYSMHPFERGPSRAVVELVGCELAVGSVRIGPPEDNEFDAWLRLQSELVSALRERFPFLPPEAGWRVTNSRLEAQLAAADAKQMAADRYQAALQVWTQLAKTYGETTAECDTRALWSRRLAEAAAESGAVPAREAFAQHLSRMEEAMVVVKSLQDAGRRSDADVAVIQYYVAEARILASR